MAIETVVVTIAGRRFPLWEEISIEMSAKAADRKATLSSADPRVVGSLTAEIALGDDATVHAGGTLLVTGYVETLAPDVAMVSGSAEHRLTITIASQSAESLEASADHSTGELKGKRLSAALNTIDPTGTVWHGIDDGTEALIRVRPGESVFEVAERLARRQGVLLIGRADGGVDIVKGVRGSHAGAIIEGDAARGYVRAGASLTLKGVPSKVIARGQSYQRWDTRSLAVEAAAKTGIGRERPVVMAVDGEATTDGAAAEASWAARRMRGVGTTGTVTLPRWRDEGRRIWTPAWGIMVSAPRLRIEQVMAITGVRLSQGQAGTLAVLQLSDPRAIAGKGKNSGSGSEWGGDGDWGDDTQP